MSTDILLVFGRGLLESITVVSTQSRNIDIIVADNLRSTLKHLRNHDHIHFKTAIKDALPRTHSLPNLADLDSDDAASATTSNTATTPDTATTTTTGAATATPTVETKASPSNPSGNSLELPASTASHMRKSSDGSIDIRYHVDVLNPQQPPLTPTALLSAAISAPTAVTPTATATATTLAVTPTASATTLAVTPTATATATAIPSPQSNSLSANTIQHSPSSSPSSSSSSLSLSTATASATAPAPAPSPSPLKTKSASRAPLQVVTKWQNDKFVTEILVREGIGYFKNLH